jgi:hypothetical protein
MKPRSAKKFEAGNHGKIVAIDIETGAFEVADDIVTASEHLLAKYHIFSSGVWFLLSLIHED